MYSAFIRVNDTWEITTNTNEVLEHVGAIFINDTPEDVSTNLAALAAAEGMFAIIRGDNVVLSKGPILRQPTDDEILAAIGQYGETFCEYLRNVDRQNIWDSAEVQIHGATNTVWRHAQLRGIIAERSSGYLFKITKNEKIWNEANKFGKRKERKQKLRDVRQHLAANDLIRKCHTLGASLGIGYLKDLSVYNFWALVTAHDAVFGIRATNKHISDLAIRWANNREKSKAWVKKWHDDEEIVKKYDERMMRAAPKGKIIKKQRKPVNA